MESLKGGAAREGKTLFALQPTAGLHGFQKTFEERIHATRANTREQQATAWDDVSQYRTTQPQKENPLPLMSYKVTLDGLSFR